MRRREFITLLGGAVAGWPLAAQAQRSERTARIGFLYPGPLAVAPPRIEIVLSGLRSAGRQGEQVELVPRVADSDPARLPRLAAELIEEKVDVVVAVSTAAVRAVQAASTTIPIVAHDLETDPVASGFIANYAQPGGRITGVFFDFPDFRTKWLELLREVIPGLASIALLWDPASGVAQLEALQAAGDQPLPPIQSRPAWSRAWRGRTETPPELPSLNLAWAASGWNCSSRSLRRRRERRCCVMRAIRRGWARSARSKRRRRCTEWTCGRSMCGTWTRSSAALPRSLVARTAG